MRKFLAVVLMFSFSAYVPLAECAASAASLAPSGAAAMPLDGAQNDQDQDYQRQDSYQLFSQEQLENLLAPIALYPDPLLAQVLLAATFPDQIDEAARAIRAYGPRYDIDGTDWDTSVKAVAHYPTVLSMMADKIDWTTSLGQAYVEQSTDLLEAGQALRPGPHAAGALAKT